MMVHSSLGNSPFERSRTLRNYILSGEIALGGYVKKRIYGKLDCASGKRMKLSNRVFFKDEQEALEHGYRPCAHCLQEKYEKFITQRR
jgi:hypothetical protein